MNLLELYITLENQKTAEWVAEDPANRWAGTMVVDLDHWHGYGIYTPKQYARYMLQAEHYDGYKEVYGVRPRWIDYDAMSFEELEVMCASLWRAAADEEEAQMEAEELDRKRMEELNESLKTFKANPALANALTAAKEKAMVAEWEADIAAQEFANNL